MANADLSVEYSVFQEEEGAQYYGFINWFGAILAVCIISTLGIWGYRLSVRDVSEVPVVRAIEGPMRVVPEDPGGVQVEHQGLAVNLVAAGGGVEAPAERLVLAPGPVALRDEDLTNRQLDLLASVQKPELEAAGHLNNPSSGGETESQELTQGPNDAEITLEGSDLSPGESDRANDVVRMESGAHLGSPLPRPRPEGDLAAQSVALAVARSIMQRSVEVEISTVPPGTPLVQFGTYDRPEIARIEWDRLKTRYPDYLRGKNWFVEETFSGGRSYYRLRTTGFDSLSDSTRFCSLFKADEQDCIAVEMRR